MTREIENQDCNITESYVKISYGRNTYTIIMKNTLSTNLHVNNLMLIVYCNLLCIDWYQSYANYMRSLVNIDFHVTYQNLFLYEVYLSIYIGIHSMDHYKYYRTCSICFIQILTLSLLHIYKLKSCLHHALDSILH